MLTSETVTFNGWANCTRLANDDVELIVNTDIGPRISRFGYRGEQNVFAEIDGQQGSQHEDDWQLRGGHRFWIAPEIKPDTYELDNVPVTSEALPSGLCTRQPAGDRLQISKKMEITLASDANRVKIVHTLTNEGNQSREVAPWALSVMAPDGMAVIPKPSFISHEDRLLHNQQWSIWGYTDFSDPRWTLGSRYVFFRQDRSRGPNKLGIAHREGWVGYLLGEFLFVKHFSWKEGARYPDGGVNFETFSNEDFLELESLAPLGILEPGASAVHTEAWSLFRGIPHCETAADIDEHVVPNIS